MSKPQPVSGWFPRLRTIEDNSLITSPSTKMAVALGAVKKPGEVYAGTVTGAEKAKRRARGKRQRAARKVARR